MRSLFLSFNRTIFSVIGLAVLTVVILIFVPSCRKKNPYIPLEPVTPNSLVLRAPAILYRGFSGHVENDTLRARVYGSNGSLVAGVLIHFQCQTSVDSCTASATSSADTSGTRWGGTSPALIYWGSGGPGGSETIYAWAILGQDTVRTSVTFQVQNLPGTAYRLTLSAPPIMHRGPNGVVVNGGITVRFFDNLGRIGPSVEVYSDAVISSGAVTGLVQTTTDTIGVHLCGSVPQMMYTGAGPAHPDSFETINSFAVVGIDTFRARLQFKVRPMPILVMNGPTTMYRDTTVGHVVNDTIPVRLYSEMGTLLNNVTLHCQASVSANRVTSITVTRSDTLNNPAGANPAVIYWGEGPTEADQQETVTCWCMVGTDTIRNHASFFVRNP